MTKRLIPSMFLITLLCGPALADARPTMQIGLRVDAGKDSRHYGIILLDHACGSIETKSQAQAPRSPSIEDFVKVCARADGAQVGLAIDWSTRDGDHEVHTKSSALVAHGGSVDLDGGTIKLRVTLQ